MAQTIVRKPAYVESLISALRKKIRGAEITAEQVRRNRYRFIVISGKFDKMGHPERQRLVWDVAGEVVPKKNLFDVSMIMTLGKKDLPA